MHTANFDTFFFDQIILVTFFKSSTCSNSSNWFDENTHPKLKSPHVEKNYENKIANECKWNIFCMYFFKYNAQHETLQLQFTM